VTAAKTIHRAASGKAPNLAFLLFCSWAVDHPVLDRKISATNESKKKRGDDKHQRKNKKASHAQRSFKQHI